MSFWEFVGIAILLLIAGSVLSSVFRGRPLFDGEEEVVVTTTTTTSEEDEVLAGDLPRQKEGDQFFVIDPVDKSKMWVNDKDDRYEDAEDKIWRVV